ncbi:MAG TPA: hypothetical protein EYP00_00500, partial [Dehalococcoidia bacterium]|nr:hypothetical protein [Dehalococcoidia bacterium]
AGAESNPYLVLAVILAGIHYGLKNKLKPLSDSLQYIVVSKT